MAQALKEAEELIESNEEYPSRIISEGITEADIEQGDYKALGVTNDGLVVFQVPSTKMSKEFYDNLKEIADKESLEITEGLTNRLDLRPKDSERIAFSFSDLTGIDPTYEGAGDLLEKIGSRLYDASTEKEKPEEVKKPEEEEITFVEGENKTISLEEGYGSVVASFENLRSFKEFAVKMNKRIEDELGRGLKVPKSHMNILKNDVGIRKKGRSFTVDLEDYLSKIEPGNCIRRGREKAYIVDAYADENPWRAGKYTKLKNRLHNLQERVDNLKSKGFDVDVEGSKKKLEEMLEERKQETPEVGASLFATYETSPLFRAVESYVPVALLKVGALKEGGKDKTKKILERASSALKGHKGLPLLEDATERIKGFKDFCLFEEERPEVIANPHFCKN